MPKLMNNLFERFFNKRSSAEEAKQIYEWIKETGHENEKDVLFTARWERSGSAQDLNVDTSKQEDIYHNILTKIEDDGKKKALHSYRDTDNVKSKSKQYWFAAMMVILSLFAGGTSFYLLNENGPAEEKVHNIPMVSKSTGMGEKLTTKLPDGTRVLLNANTRIEYEVAFAGEQRIVKLDGEAYFEVVKNIQKPFIVKSGAVETTALGTEFNINSRSGDNEVVVSLTEGKVLVKNAAVDDPNQGHILRPGEAITYNNKGNLLSLEEFDYDKYIGWKDGVLYFDEANVSELKYKLESWYGVEINLMNHPEKNWRFTSVYKNESLENVLKGLQFAKNISYEIEAKKVKIKFEQKKTEQHGMKKLYAPK